jgi:hypothetical protein
MRMLYLMDCPLLTVPLWLIYTPKYLSFFFFEKLRDALLYQGYEHRTLWAHGLGSRTELFTSLMALYPCGYSPFACAAEEWSSFQSCAQSHISRLGEGGPHKPLLSMVNRPQVCPIYCSSLLEGVTPGLQGLASHVRPQATERRQGVSHVSIFLLNKNKALESLPTPMYFRQQT